MAVPAFRSAGAQLAGSSSTTANVAVPAGVVAGDIVLVFFYVETTQAVTAPAGFTEAPGSPATVTGSSAHNQRIFWKRTTGADSGTYAFTIASGLGWREAFAIAVSGCVATGSPFDFTNSAVKTTTTTGATPAVSGTTLDVDRLLIWSATLFNYAAATVPTGFTKRVEYSSDNALVAADKTQPTAGATGSITGSFAGNNATSAWLGALLPASADPAPTFSSGFFSMFFRAASTGVGYSAPADVATAVSYSSAEILNPARGQFEDIGIAIFPQGDTKQSAYAAWPGTKDISRRYRWSDIQPSSSGSYTWTLLDADIAAAAAAGRRFDFRVMPFNPDDNSCTPSWITGVSGASTLRSGFNVPNWDSNGYLTVMENLIAAIGARYNSDERVAWFEFSGYGDYGECHCSSMPSKFGVAGATDSTSPNAMTVLGYHEQLGYQYINKTSITRLVTAHVNAFTKTRLVFCMENVEITRQMLAASTTKVTGVRHDSLGKYDTYPWWAVTSGSYYVVNNDPLVAAVQAQWKVAPVVGEGAINADGTINDYFNKWITDIVNDHISLASSQVFTASAALSAGNFDKWARGVKFSGYRYASSAVVAGTAVTVTWTNFGTAPTYDNWDIVYEVRNASNTVVQTVNSTLELSTLYSLTQNLTSTTTSEPTPKSVTDGFTLTSLPSGSYTISARVDWNEHKASGTNVWSQTPMALALTGRTAAGAYVVGSFTK